MPKFLGFPKFRATDSTGAPLAGGYLFCYDPGSFVVRKMYPTLADAEAGTNYFTSKQLDSRGEATIVMSGTSKFLLLDSGFNTIWTVDNVTEASVSNLIDKNGNLVVEATAASSPVNYITMSNSAANDAIEISATGTDSNISIELKPKGTGDVNFYGGVALEQGSKQVGFTVPSTIESSYDILILGDGTSGQVYTSDGSGGLTAGSSTLNDATVQFQYMQTTTGWVHTTSTSVIPPDGTIPQDSEGREIYRVNVTPTDVGATLLVSFEFDYTGTARTVAAMFVDGTANAFASILMYEPGTYRLVGKVSPATTSQISIAVRFSAMKWSEASSTYTWKSSSGATGYKKSITIVEI